jgi:hypothetical protein
MVLALPGGFPFAMMANSMSKIRIENCIGIIGGRLIADDCDGRLFSVRCNGRATTPADKLAAFKFALLNHDCLAWEPVTDLDWDEVENARYDMLATIRVFRDPAGMPRD